MMLVPWQEGTQAELVTQGMYIPTEVESTGTDVDMTIFDAFGRIRLDPDSTYKPTIGFKYTHFDLDTSDAAIPDGLTDVAVAYGGSFGDVDLGQTLGTWDMGFSVGVGYSGPTTFENGDAWYGKADLFAVKPIDRDTRWLVGINYDGNRVFLPDVPLPAVSYFARASETVTYAVGIPFSRVTYKPDDAWTIDIRTVLFFNFNGSVRYQATEQLEIYAAYIIRNDAFTAASTARDNRRFIFSQQRVELGLSYDINPRLTLTAAGGVVLSQEIDFDYDVRDANGLRDLEDAPFVRVGLEFAF